MIILSLELKSTARAGAVQSIANIVSTVLIELTGTTVHLAGSLASTFVVYNNSLTFQLLLQTANL